MSITHTITKTWASGTSAPLSKSVSFVGVRELNIDAAVAASTTNQQELLSFTAASLLEIFISSTQNVTIKTNSSSSPQETLTITGGDPLQWDNTCGIAIPFSGDVTSIFITNAGASSATVSIRTLE